jgi:chaperonin cofactor prefoldin
MVLEKERRLSQESRDIERIEQAIYKRINDMNLPQMYELLTEIVRISGESLEKEILAKQLRLVEAEERRMNEKYEELASTLQSKIENTSKKTTQYAVQRSIALKSLPDNGLFVSGESGEEALEDLKEKLETVTTRRRSRAEIIQKWKNDIKGILLSNNNGNLEGGGTAGSLTSQKSLGSVVGYNNSNLHIARGSQSSNSSPPREHLMSGAGNGGALLSHATSEGISEKDREKFKGVFEAFDRLLSERGISFQGHREFEELLMLYLRRLEEQQVYSKLSSLIL